MGPVGGVNDTPVKRFYFQEYIDRIVLEDYLLKHMEETNRNFDEYMRYLLSLDNNEIFAFLVGHYFNEIISSFKMEHAKLVDFNLIDKNDLFFNSFNISHRKIQSLHNFVMKVTGQEQIGANGYRVKDVRVSKITQQGELVFFRGVQKEDIKFFMDQLIEVYKSKSLSVIHTNPFFKSAIIHLLCVRIQPFLDGNKRTARLLYGMRFTNSINDIYGLNLKICPLNISPNMFINHLTYAKRINDIWFDMEHDNNEELNNWLNFILDMVDEQIFYISSNMRKLIELFMDSEISRKFRNDELIEQYEKKMRLK